MTKLRSPLAVLAIVLTAALSVGTLPSTAHAEDSARRAGPVLKLTPSVNVKAGATITVAGTGYPKNSSIYIVQCSNLTSQSACDLGRLVVAKTNSRGAFSAKFKVLAGSGKGKCAKGKRCYVGAGTTKVSKTAAFTFAR